MKLPAGARDIEEGVKLLSARYDRIKAFVLAEIAELENSGLADKRWCAIARTDIEKGFLGLTNALPSARDGRNYGKVPVPDDASPGPAPKNAGDWSQGGAPLRIEWRDVT